MHNLWTIFLYQPLYNTLIFLTQILPKGDLGVAIVLLTILVKLVLYPLTKKSIESQAAIARLQPELERIKKQHADKQIQAQKTMELYKAEQTGPFSGCLVMLIQLPIILALYYVFYRGFADNSLLYSFIKAPEHLNTLFLGLVDISKPNLVFAIIAGVSQFLQMRIAFAGQSQSANAPGGDMMKAMQTQMQFVLPLMIIVIGTRLSGAVALYWITSNMVGALQEYFIRVRLGQVIKII